ARQIHLNKDPPGRGVGASESGQCTKSLRDSGSSGLVLSAVPGEEIVDRGGVLRIELSLTSSNVMRHAWQGTMRNFTPKPARLTKRSDEKMRSDARGDNARHHGDREGPHPE